nr:MAG: hypothetical protein BECKMB1821G_GA0114241_11181 [Candidatus Kentron sp. MB]VFK35372.1 MAG: hypothetical protein BECKMB1821I_GA0114274_11146 [Candidatus Kentron sp. MB]
MGDKHPSEERNQSVLDRFSPSDSALARPRKKLPRNRFLFIQIRDKKINKILNDLKSEFSSQEKSSTNHITVNGPKKFFKKKH